METKDKIIRVLKDLAMFESDESDYMKPSIYTIKTYANDIMRIVKQGERNEHKKVRN